MSEFEAMWYEGKKLAEQGREEEAISQFLAAVQADEGGALGDEFTGWDWYYRSLVESRLSRSEPALLSIEKACQIEPNVWNFWYHRSGLQALKQEFEAGFESAQRATSLEPKSPLAWRRLAELSLLSSEQKSAWLALEEMEALHAEPAIRQQFWWTLSRLFLSTGDFDMAWQALSRGKIVGGETEKLAIEILKGSMTPAWLAKFWDKKKWQASAVGEFDQALSGEELRNIFVNGEHFDPRPNREGLAGGRCVMGDRVLRYAVDGAVLKLETWKRAETPADVLEEDEEWEESTPHQFEPLDSSAQDSMLESWQRIIDWLKSNSPEHLSSLGSSATVSDIAEVEREFGHPLPPDLKEFLKIHGDILGVFEEWSEFGDLHQCLALWKELRDGLYLDLLEIGNEGRGDPGVRNLWWDLRWFPIASNGSGDHLMVDLWPAKDGTFGQLIEWRHDDEQRRLLGPSFTAWLASVADSLESGSYVPG